MTKAEATQEMNKTTKLFGEEKLCIMVSQAEHTSTDHENHKALKRVQPHPTRSRTEMFSVFVNTISFTIPLSIAPTTTIGGIKNAKCESEEMKADQFEKPMNPVSHMLCVSKFLITHPTLNTDGDECSVLDATIPHFDLPR